jgi:nucleoside-diphosphate-sugar epimerase
MKGNAALRVAITGANGNIGRKLIAALLAAPEIAAIHAIDRDVAGLSPHDARLFSIQADLRGPGLLDALAGIDAVIHLAAQNPYPDATWEDASASFDMTAKLGEACAKASVSRLVFASSNHVMGGYKDTPVALSDGGLTTDLPPLVGTLVKTSEGLIDSTAYAAAKLMGERALTVKAETGAFSAVSLRIGWCQPGENSPETISAAGTPKSSPFETDPEREHDLRWFRAMWLSNSDLVRGVFAALRADASTWPSPAIVVNAMSMPRRRRRAEQTPNAFSVGLTWRASPALRRRPLANRLL